MIRLLHCRLVVLFVQLLIAVSPPEVTPLLTEMFLCLSLLSSEAKCQIGYKKVSSFTFLRTFRPKK